MTMESAKQGDAKTGDSKNLSPSTTNSDSNKVWANTAADSYAAKSSGTKGDSAKGTASSSWSAPENTPTPAKGKGTAPVESAQPTPTSSSCSAKPVETKAPTTPVEKSPPASNIPTAPVESVPQPIAKKPVAPVESAPQPSSTCSTKPTPTTPVESTTPPATKKPTAPVATVPPAESAPKTGTTVAALQSAQSSAAKPQAAAPENQAPAVKKSPTQLGAPIAGFPYGDQPFFDRKHRKVDFPPIPSDNAVPPKEQTTQIMETPRDKAPIPPTGAFTGKGAGPGDRVVTRVPANKQASSDWLEIPKMLPEPVQIVKVGTVAEEKREVPPTIGSGNIAAPPNFGSIAEWKHKIPGKVVDVAEGPGEHSKGPFFGIGEVLKPGDIIKRHDANGELVEYTVTKVEANIDRNDQKAWKDAFGAVAPGTPDQWVGVSCLPTGEYDAYGLNPRRSVVIAARTDGKSTQNNGTVESEFKQRQVETSAEFLKAPRKSVEVAVPPPVSVSSGTSITVGARETSGKGGSKAMAEVQANFNGLHLEVTSNPSLHLSGDIRLVKTDKDVVLLRPGVGVNFGDKYPTSDFAPVVPNGLDADLRATWAHRIAANGAAAFLSAGAVDANGTQKYLQIGANIPIGLKGDLTVGVSGQNGNIGKQVLGNSVGPFGKFTYRINKDSAISITAGSAGGETTTEVQYTRDHI